MPAPATTGTAAERARVRSPDQLDGSVEVTSTRSWIALTAAGLAVLVLLVWSVAGEIPERVSVGGVMTRQGAIVEVLAPSSGVVTEVATTPSHHVAAGDVLATLQDSDGNAVQIVAPTAGVVQGVGVRTSMEVTAGSPVATIVEESSTTTLRAITYVSPLVVQQLSGIDDVTVVPASVDQAEYGSLEGTISFVADVPASAAEMATVLGTEELADEFDQVSGGIPYLVVIEFDEPPVWSNDDAPPFEIVAGTIAEISAIVSRERPIDRVF